MLGWEYQILMKPSLKDTLVGALPASVSAAQALKSAPIQAEPLLEQDRLFFVDLYADHVRLDPDLNGFSFQFNVSEQHLDLMYSKNLDSLQKDGAQQNKQTCPQEDHEGDQPDIESQNHVNQCIFSSHAGLKKSIVFRNHESEGKALKSLTLTIEEGLHLSCIFMGMPLDQKLQLEAGASLQLFTRVSGCERVKVSLKGEGASLALQGLMEGHQKERLSYDLTVRHEAHSTESKIEMRGIADQESQISFSGLICVPPEIRQVVADLQTANLLLSSKARIDARPELEIESDEVVCHHGASVGNLDENALFYLESRGFLKAEARALLVDAFRALAFKDFSSIAKWLNRPMELHHEQ